MKSCSKCTTVYSDNELNFCLEDGSPLSHPINVDLDLPTKRFVLVQDPIAPKTLIMNPMGSSAGETKRRVARLKAIDSIAVLPFANVSVDPAKEYIVDGITESIINELSQLGRLRVVARNTAFRYKGLGVDLRVLSQRLNVRVFLTGRVRELGNRLIVGTELVDGTSGFQLWGQHFEFKLADIFDVQHTIAKEISEKLSLKFSVNYTRRSNKRTAVSTEAFELYLKGRFHWNTLTEEGFFRSVEFFEASCEKEPTFALAHAGVADAYGALAYFNYVSPREAFPLSGKSAARALELDDTLAEAHLSLASFRFFFECDWQLAEFGFKRAIDLRPSCASAHHIYGHCLASLGRFDEAIAEMERAHKFDPLSVIIGCSLGFTFYRSRNYDEAIRHFQNVLDLIPTLPLAHEGLGAVYLETGADDEAVAEYLNAMSHWPRSDKTIPALRQAFNEAGITGFWRKWLEHCGEDLKPDLITPYHVAGAYARIGEKELAFKWLEKAFEERIGFIIYLKVEPMFDNLRTDPRFGNLLRRVGL